MGQGEGVSGPMAVTSTNQTKIAPQILRAQGLRLRFKLALLGYPQNASSRILEGGGCVLPLALLLMLLRRQVCSRVCSSSM